ncbi:MAG: hypothetical protein AB7F86_15730 [Bdellovibrionales bacterium]
MRLKLILVFLYALGVHSADLETEMFGFSVPITPPYSPYYDPGFSGPNCFYKFEWGREKVQVQVDGSDLRICRYVEKIPIVVNGEGQFSNRFYRYRYDCGDGSEASYVTGWNGIMIRFNWTPAIHSDSITCQ